MTPSRLGPPLHLARVNAVVGWFVFTLGALVLLTWVGLSVGYVSFALGRHREGVDLWIGPVILAVLFAPIGSILAYKGYQGRVLELGVHEGGISYRDSSRALQWAWNEIVSVSCSQSAHATDVGLGLALTTHKSAKVEIVSARQGMVVVDERFPDHVTLATHVRDAAARGMLPVFEAALSAGQRVYFGGLGVDGWGLHGTVTMPWTEIGQVRWVSDGHFARYAIVDAQGAHRGDIPCPVPNEAILRVVLERFGKLGEGAPDEAPIGDRLLGEARRMFG